MKRFKIGTFNLYNLVLPKVTYYTNQKYSVNMYQRKLAWIGSQIDAMDADIIGFQEVFHQQALEEAIQKSSWDQANVVVKGETGTGPVVGLATRFDLVDEPVSFQDIPVNAKLNLGNVDVGITTFSRPVLKCKINVPEFGVLVMFVAHLKSKRPEFIAGEDEQNFVHQSLAAVRALIRRGVEAAGLRSLVLEEVSDSNTPVVVVGDLNDSDTAVTTQVISGEPPWKFSPVYRKKVIWDKLLYNTFELQSRRSLKKTEYTHIYNGHYEILDHIFVSQEFKEANPDHIGSVEYVHYFNDHLVDGVFSNEPVPKWKSDHAQIVVTIKKR